MRLQGLSGQYGLTDTTDKIRAWFSRYSDNPLAFALIAEAENKCVGYALCDLLAHPTQTGVSAMIEEVCVSEPYRREGIGRSLVDHVRDRLLSSVDDLTTIRARVDREDERASSFWRSLGLEHHVMEFTDYLE